MNIGTTGGWALAILAVRVLGRQVVMKGPFSEVRHAACI